MSTSIGDGGYDQEGIHSGDWGFWGAGNIPCFELGGDLHTCLLYDYTLNCIYVLFQIHITFYKKNKLLCLPKFFIVAISNQV